MVRTWKKQYEILITGKCCQETSAPVMRNFEQGDLYYPIRFLHCDMSQSACSIHSRLSAPSSVNQQPKWPSVPSSCTVEGLLSWSCFDKTSTVAQTTSDGRFLSGYVQWRG